MGALPWWSVTRGAGHDTAAVWSASTVATAALSLAALVSVVALARARTARTGEKELIAAVAWLPVTLLAWEAATILTRSLPVPGSQDAQFQAAVAKQAPQFAHPYGTIYPDHLMRLSQDGAHQGFGPGAVLGAVLVVGQAVLLTIWARRGAGEPARRWWPAVAGLWLVVAALPWWSSATDVGDASGVHTVHHHAAVWRASTLATAAVVLALLVTVALVRGTDRRVATVFAWASLGLVVWQVAEIVKPVSSSPTITIVALGASGTEEPPWLVRDRLSTFSGSGLHEGFGWGAWLGLLLIVAQAGLLTWRLRRSDSPVGE